MLGELLQKKSGGGTTVRASCAQHPQSFFAKVPRNLARYDAPPAWGLTIRNGAGVYEKEIRPIISEHVTVSQQPRTNKRRLV